MSSEITEKRNACIDSLKYIVDEFKNKERNKSYTRVIPLVIPTGWGKTSIVLKSVLTTTNNANEQNRTTIVLWPKNEKQVSEVWKKDKNLPNRYPNDLWEWKHLSNEESSFNSQYQKYIGYINNTDMEKGKFSIGREGNIIFIIDEWHSKGLFDYIDSNNIEQSIRDVILPSNNRRNLLVLLVSATPISLVKEMRNDEEDSFQDNEILNNQMTTFSQLIQIGNQDRLYKFFDFKELFRDEICRLQKRREKLSFESFEPNKEIWAKEYINILNKIDKVKKQNTKKQEPFSFSRVEQEIIAADSASLKNQTLINFLCKEENKTRNFVIFCFHNNVAEKLENTLKKNVNCTVTRITDESTVKSFNSDENQRMILILTNKSSEGLSLHESGAWIIHYELDWNPIRIIQRFGRVWRLVNGTKARNLKNSRKCFVNRNLPSENSENDLFLTDPVAFYLPFTYSMEEEKLKRLKMRWKYLEEKLDNNVNCNIKIKDTLVPMDIALGIRLTPSVI